MKKIIITETQLKKIVLSEEEQFKKPIFKGVKKIKYRETDGKHKLLVTISVENPSSFNLKIKNYNIGVYIDGHHILPKCLKSIKLAQN